MAWVFRKCRSTHAERGIARPRRCGALASRFPSAPRPPCTPSSLAKVASLPAWMQLLHPLATVMAKSKLLVLPVYPAAWPQAREHPFVQAPVRDYRFSESLISCRRPDTASGRPNSQLSGRSKPRGGRAAFVGLGRLSRALSAVARRPRRRGRKGSRAAAAGTVAGPVQGSADGGGRQELRAPATPQRKQSIVRASEKSEQLFPAVVGEVLAEYYEAKEREEAAEHHGTARAETDRPSTIGRPRADT